MSILIMAFLGLVQGFTEFLPVSSSGHLILFQHLFGHSGDNLLFNIILHIATLCAVCIVFRKTLWRTCRHPFNKMNLCIIITTAVTSLLVVLFKDIIDKTFSYKILPFSFMATAIVLYLPTLLHAGKSAAGIKSAVIVGVAQAIAVVPGLSRSGTTISTLVASGVERGRAGEYSFLMSIPIIIASFVYEMLSGTVGKIEFAPTAVAFVAALIGGIIAIKFTLKIIKNAKLHYFSYYLVALSLVCLGLFYLA
jgi:undecaprenyl-diphosphatase